MLLTVTRISTGTGVGSGAGDSTAQHFARVHPARMSTPPERQQQPPPGHRSRCDALPQALDLFQEMLDSGCVARWLRHPCLSSLDPRSAVSLSINLQAILLECYEIVELKRQQHGSVQLVSRLQAVAAQLRCQVARAAPLPAFQRMVELAATVVTEWQQGQQGQAEQQKGGEGARPAGSGKQKRRQEQRRRAAAKATKGQQEIRQGYQTDAGLSSVPSLEDVVSIQEVAAGMLMAYRAAVVHAEGQREEWPEQGQQAQQGPEHGQQGQLEEAQRGQQGSGAESQQAQQGPEQGQQDAQAGDTADGFADGAAGGMQERLQVAAQAQAAARCVLSSQTLADWLLLHTHRAAASGTKQAAFSPGSTSASTASSTSASTSASSGGHAAAAAAAALVYKEERYMDQPGTGSRPTERYCVVVSLMHLAVQCLGLAAEGTQGLPFFSEQLLLSLLADLGSVCKQPLVSVGILDSMHPQQACLWYVLCLSSSSVVVHGLRLSGFGCVSMFATELRGLPCVPV